MSVNGEELRLYQEQKARRRVLVRLATLASAIVLLLILFYALFAFYFVVREVTVEGSERYGKDELMQTAGIAYKDNLIVLSSEEIESKIKDAYPYVKSVTVKKSFPDSLTLVIQEEYTVFSYEMLGEYFLFNPELRLMERFTSYEALSAVRKAISVEMPMPKSCIVPQYIQLQEGCEYVTEMIECLSASKLVSEITRLDLRDKFVIRMEVGKGITVEFGDCTMIEEKLFSLYELIGSNSQNLTGSIDMSDYPNCFYHLTPKS